MTERIVTRNDLWLEFKRAIDYGHFKKFKTKRGMNGYLDRLIKQCTGTFVKFKFSPGLGNYTEYVYKITKEDIECLKLSR